MKSRYMKNKEVIDAKLNTYIGQKKESNNKPYTNYCRKNLSK
jgi:hypothetical protein